MQIAVLGRLIAGVGASGMTDLISVLIVGKILALATIIITYHRPRDGLVAATYHTANAPILLMCLIMVAIKLPKHTPEGAQLRPAEDGKFPEERSMDFFGIAFLGITVALFILICSAFTDESWLNHIKWEILAALILFGALFFGNEVLWAKDPFIPLKLAATNGIDLAWLTQILLNFAICSVSQNSISTA
ncbi:MFS transporter [Penicillium frequentans]|uniref:MFS transporter n=1 Tax=Penicillium frequentans TaxID=3151616 RepID=A0AAD6D3P6_9EURO|nr:MFS transporter [Penicillium glabrum]